MTVNTSCSKLGQIIPIPPPGVIQSLEQNPFKTYSDSLLALSVTNNVGSILTISGQVLAQTDVPTPNGGKWTYVSLRYRVYPGVVTR